MQPEEIRVEVDPSQEGTWGANIVTSQVTRGTIVLKTTMIKIVIIQMWFKMS